MGKQQQHGVLAASGGDICVEEGEEDHRDPERNAINRLETPAEKVIPAYQAMSQTGMAVL